MLSGCPCPPHPRCGAGSNGVRRSGLEVLLERLAGDTAVSARSAPDGALWIVTSNTDRATWGGTDPRPRDDRIIRIELPAQN